MLFLVATTTNHIFYRSWCWVSTTDINSQRNGSSEKIVFRFCAVCRICWRWLGVNQSRRRRRRLGRTCGQKRGLRFFECSRSFSIFGWSTDVLWCSSRVEGGQAADSSFGFSVFNLLDGQALSSFVFLKIICTL